MSEKHRRRRTYTYLMTTRSRTACNFRAVYGEMRMSMDLPE